MVRDPYRARPLSGPNVRLVRGDLGDPVSLDAAAAGVDAVFLACANVPEQVDHECAVINAAAACGVRRIVKLSARGAALGAPVAFWHWHAMIEQQLRSSGVPSVVLRPGFLMTNLLSAAEPVRDQGVLFAPAAAARIAMIDPADVAAAAAVTLTAHGYDGATHVLTGPEAVTYQEVAADLSAATGRRIDFADSPPQEASAALVGGGVPQFAAAQIVAVFDALRRGEQAETTRAVHTITGRAPRSLSAFAQEHTDAFAPRVALDTR